MHERFWRGPSEWTTLRWLWRLSARERWYCVLVVVIGLISSALEVVSLSLFIPLAQLVTAQAQAISLPFVSAFVSWLSPAEEFRSVALIMLIVGLLVASAISQYLAAALNTAVAMLFAGRVRRLVLESAMAKPMSILERHGDGYLANIMLNEPWRACDGLFAVLNIMVQATAIIIFLGALLVISPEYSVYFTLLSVASSFVVYAATKHVKQIGQRTLQENELYTARLLDLLRVLRIIRAHGRESYALETQDERARELARVNVHMALVRGGAFPLARVLGTVLLGALVALAAARGDDMSVVLGFLLVAYRLQPRIVGIIAQRANLAAVSPSIASIAEFLDSAPPRRGGGLPFERLDEGLRIERATVRYPGAESAALVDVSCRIRKGELTAVAGGSGAGKSTLVGLLLGFNALESGRILVDGVPLDELRSSDWHSRLGYVSHDAMVFSGSVRDNIAFGDPDVTEEQVIKAARQAHADGFIRGLPEGYDTVLGANGVDLSNGQRQRIALARALVRDPEILILDEATNALDEPTERAIRQALEAWRKTRLVVVIAHRRETVEDADHVIVLENGRVVGEGGPKALAGRCRQFDDLYRPAPLAGVGAFAP